MTSTLRSFAQARLYPEGQRALELPGANAPGRPPWRGPAGLRAVEGAQHVDLCESGLC